MGRPIDEKGNCYGRLTVQRRAQKRCQRGRSAAYWWCRCDCGNEVTVRGTSLRNGAVKSCGCLRREHASKIGKRGVIDLEGNRYGRLVVLGRVNPQSGRVSWLCRCDCGTEVAVRATSLRTGNTKSCGCLHKEHVRELNLLPEGIAAFSAMRNKMKTYAEKRGHEWQLTDEQIRQLTKQSCHYCGAKPLQVSGGSGFHGNYVYNGLDRVDNAKGYTIDNVVPCCKACNFAKGARTLEEFKIWATQLYQHFVKGE